MTDSIDFQGRKLPLRKYMTLVEVARWIAARVPPTDMRHSAFTESACPSEDELQKAKLDLYEDLMNGRLTAFGYKKTEAEVLTPNQQTLKPQPIDKGKWIFPAIDWKNSALGFDVNGWAKPARTYKGGWLHVEIETVAVMRKHPANSVTPSTTEIKQTRENALHLELRALFQEWGKPNSNQKCWKLLREVDWDERDTVVQEVIDDKSHKDGCHILWQSPSGIEQRMKRNTFDNVMSRIRRKNHG